MEQSKAEQELVALARRVLPAGSFGNLALDIVVARGERGRVWDVSGNEYVDYLLGSGPMLIGHNHPDVTAAVQEQLGRGTTFFANNEAGIRLAAELVEAVPCAEQVRFLSSGSEATFYAMRVARAFRKRDKVLKFEGGFHGMSDYALMSMAPKRLSNFPSPVPDSAGIPQVSRDAMLIAPFNDAALAESLIREHADELAAVIVEPFQRLIPPAPGFLQHLRTLCTELGVVLVFDEVVTGFRFAYGGAQAYYGVTPDLAALGKVIGGGFPLSAVVGRADIMAHLDAGKVPADDFVPQIGTLSGNPVAATAGLATLKVLREPDTYERLFETGRHLMATLQGLLDEAGVPAVVLGEPPLFDVLFLDGEVSDYRATLKADAAKLKTFNLHLRTHGILKGESKYYLSTAHDDADVEQTVAAWRSAVAAIAG
jgi:glutamate-1-semialdehyde 2,1-aminomutase